MVGGDTTRYIYKKGLDKKGDCLEGKKREEIKPLAALMCVPVIGILSVFFYELS